MITEVFIAVDRDEVYRATLPPGEYVIGRDPDAQIRIQHPTISRRHAKLIVEEDQLVLSDLDSGNGTMIEETPVVGASHFYEGQTARLGDVLLRARQNVTPELLPPSIGNYRKGGMVASGGMGAIHEARQSAMGRKVAMKVMLREGSGSGLRRFINEARITGMLEHPNIVPVHELGVDADGRAFYTMKFVHGTTLAEVLAGLRTGHAEAVKKYPLSFLLTVFQKVCDAVAFAHSRGVHHRDLKPENVMIGEFGEVLVMDWGLSKETGFDSEAEDVLPGSQSGDGTGWRTMEGSVLGTPAYMSPEQARGEIEAVDARSDIYCLGAILHEILYLQPPVSGGSAHEIVDKVGRGETDPVHDMERPHWPGGTVPSSLEAVRRKAMAFDAVQRYQSVTDLQSDITAYQSGFATSAEEAGVATQAVLFFKRNRGVSLAVLGGLILLGVVSVGFIWRLQGELAKTQKAVAQAEQNALQAVENERRAEENLAIAKENERQADEQRQIAVENLRKFKEQEGETLKESLRAERSESERDLLMGDKEEAAKKFFDSAREAVRGGNLDKAMRDTDAALERAPKNPVYLELKADLLQSGGQLAEAAKQYRLAIENGAGDRAKANLRWCEKQQDGGLASEETYRELAALLADQGRDFELVFLDEARRGEVARTQESQAGDGQSVRIPEKLRSLEGWSDERVVLSPDGTTVGLDLSGLPVRSLEDLRALKLRSLDLRGTEVTDLSPLEGKPLEEFYTASAIRDLSSLRVDNLRVLDLRGSQIADLGPLAGAKMLERLWLDNMPVKDLEPLRGLPLKLLHADMPGVENFDVVGSLTGLEDLALPKHAAGVPVAGLAALKKVRHPRFQFTGEIEGQEFKELSAKSDQAWRQWRGALVKMAGPVLGPDRVTVVEENWNVPRAFPDTFDLDLRGLEIADLRPLRNIPLNRLYLDTKAQPVDLRPLEKHGTLQHLVLAGANVPSLQGVLDRQALKSIVLSTETANVRRLYSSPTISWAGYEFDASMRLPTTTVKELFAERDPKSALPPHPRSGSRTEAKYLFDDPGMSAGRDIERWKLSPAPGGGAGGLVWQPDPPSEGGLGGGYLEFFERAEDNETNYFVLPNNFRNKRTELYGASLGFEMAVEGDGGRKAGSDLVVRSGGNSLHYTFSGRQPSKDWRKFHVIFREGEGWTVGSANGNPATAEEMKSALEDVREFLIRAEYFEGGNYERTRLDNVALWDIEETGARVQEAREEERKKNSWITVESAPVEDFSRRMNLSGGFDESKTHFRVAEHQGRLAPLLVRAESVDKPARIMIQPENRTEAGTLVRLAARGAPNVAGVRVRVLQGGRLLQEVPVGDQWTEVFALLPQGSAGKGEALCVVEISLNGDLDPYCFISGLELVPPSRRN